MDSDLANKLEQLINENIERANIPVVKGNSIRLKNYVIRKSKFGWLVYDTETNKQEAKFFCRASALAYANLKIKKIKNIRSVFDLDKTVEKHYNDCVFYLYTLKKTKDNFKKEVVRTRYDISYLETKHATRSLEQIFLR